MIPQCRSPKDREPHTSSDEVDVAFPLGADRRVARQDSGIEEHGVHLGGAAVGDAVDGCLHAGVGATGGADVLEVGIGPKDRRARDDHHDEGTDHEKGGESRREGISHFHLLRE